MCDAKDRDSYDQFFVYFLYSGFIVVSKKVGLSCKCIFMTPKNESNFKKECEIIESWNIETELNVNLLKEVLNDFFFKGYGESF